MSSVQYLFITKPKSLCLGNVEELESLIEKYPYQNIKVRLYDLLSNFSYYRSVYGDGNCFYRACAFLYLSLANLSSFASTFKQVNIFQCAKLPFQNKLGWRSKQYLQYIWQKYLKSLAKLDTNERQRQIAQIINKSHIIDMVLIAYMRVLTANYISQNRDKFIHHIEGSFEARLKKITTFSQETQDMQVFALSQSIGYCIKVFAVLQQLTTLIQYNQEKQKIITLFFRPGHYEILCDQSKFKAQNKSRIPKTQSSLLRDKSNIYIQKYSIRNSQDVVKMQRLTKDKTVIKPIQSSVFKSQDMRKSIQSRCLFLIKNEQKKQASKIKSSPVQPKQQHEKKPQVKKPPRTSTSGVQISRKGRSYMSQAMIIGVIMAVIPLTLYLI